MSITTTEKNLDKHLWGRRNCANQGDPTVTDTELTVSAKVLDRYTSKEQLAKLFHSKEQAEFLAELSVSLLATYPNYPYHQPAHGVDVMHSTRLLTEVVPAAVHRRTVMLLKSIIRPRFSMSSTNLVQLSTSL